MNPVIGIQLLTWPIQPPASWPKPLQQRGLLVYLGSSPAEPSLPVRKDRAATPSATDEEAGLECKTG